MSDRLRLVLAEYLTWAMVAAFVLALILTIAGGRVTSLATLCGAVVLAWALGLVVAGV